MRPLLGVLLLGAFSLAIRLAVFEQARPVSLIGDEVYYAETALAIANGQGLQSAALGSRAAWPPAQSFLLALASDPAAPIDPERLQRVAILLGSLLPLLVLALARALFDARTAWIAGIAAAVYPEFVAYSHYLWSETLFTALVTGAFALAVRAQRGPLQAAAATGLLFGLSALTREEGLLLGGCCALWWAFAPGARGVAFARAAVLLAAMLATVAPWTARNQLVLGRFVPISTVGWMGVAEGNLLGDDWRRVDPQVLRRFRAEYSAIPDETARMDFARETALRAIAAEQPGWLAEKLVRNLPLLLAPDSFVLKKLARGSYGDVPLGRRRAIFAVTALAYLAVTGLALVGVASLRGERRWLALLCTGSVLGLHVIANASSRYRFPLMPLALVYAAHAVARGREAWRDAGPLGLVCAGLAALVLLASTAAFAPEAASLWSSGQYLDPLRP